MTYTHRNGETEPPTISGRYWLQGHMPQGTEAHPWGYDFGEGDELPYSINVEDGEIEMGDSYTEPLSKFQGQFWGPVPMPVPPWEASHE